MDTKERSSNFTSGSRRSLRWLWIAASVLIASTISLEAHAFITNETQQFQADIDEAIARSRDFKKYLERSRKQEELRMAAAEESKRRREKQEAELESVRREFVAERDRAATGKLAEERERERLEREYEKMMAEEEKRNEESRRRYVQKRDRVRATIEKDAFIDPYLEFGLSKSPGS